MFCPVEFSADNIYLIGWFRHKCHSVSAVRNHKDSVKFTVILLSLCLSSFEVGATTKYRIEIIQVVSTRLLVSPSREGSKSNVTCSRAACAHGIVSRRIIWFRALVGWPVCSSFSALKQGYVVPCTPPYSYLLTMEFRVYDLENGKSGYICLSGFCWACLSQSAFACC